MTKMDTIFLFTVFLFISLKNSVLAQNPSITDPFSADPSVRVFGDREYE